MIGRENISDVDGAIIELIKNSYDADADCVFVKFIMPFPNVPKNIELDKLKDIFEKDELNKILTYYELKNNKFIRKNNLDDNQLANLQELLFSKNEIILIDNGTGMSQAIMETSWMNIGTSDKDINIYSQKGRIKTGAKGIGRFALDKLSIKSQVYTKNEDDKLIYWGIDWNQFANAKLLNQVKADLELLDITYESMVRKLLGKDFEKIKHHDWDSGTIIILKPTREPWTERLFNKVNTNIKSINPLGTVDTFEVFIENEYNNELSYHTDSLSINESEYDYRIRANYDGNNKMKLSLKRNEIDINKEEVTVEVNKKQYTFPLGEFWSREAFKKDTHRRKDYNKEIIYEYQIEDLLKDDDINNVNNIGPFSLDFYFLKGSNSDFGIVKSINMSKRKELLRNFSGIKLYRDNFKVRPYGDDGSLYDWLSLGQRAQRSPAGVAHPYGDWRTLPYQTIGSVNISRIDNPKLSDMANREGLSLNDTYYIFINLIQKILEKFEYDRQYVYREYAAWIKAKSDEVDKVGTIVNDVNNKYQEKKGKEKESSSKTENNSGSIDDDNQGEKEQEYTKEDYEEAIYTLGKGAQDELKTSQILMAFSSSGVITNTFAHEISRISTEMGSRIQNIRVAIKRLLNYKEYEGDEDFNPFEMLKEAESTDSLLNTWIKVIMNAVESKNFDKENLSLNNFVNEIVENWSPLMEKKYITITHEFDDQDVNINISKVDLYLIFNNFFLNSAWFLEKIISQGRKIYIQIKNENDNILIYLMNNGPTLDESFKNNPDEIFNAGVTVKKQDEGTGLGLWITREVVTRNSGQIHVMNKSDGFGISISFPK
nr:sensor histidine kinase [Clostridium beijerinckii]